MKEDGPQLRFYNYLSPSPRAAPDKKGPWRITSKNQAVTQRFIQLPNHIRQYICLDLDYEMAGARWMDEVMLEPTIVLINPENSHAKYLFELYNPVYFPKSNGERAVWISQKPIRFYQNVKVGLDQALDGDPGYTGNNINNPFHPHWKVHWRDIRYDLQELGEYIPCVRKEYFKNDDEIYEGREKQMFHHCRVRLYSQVKNYTTFEDWKAAVEKYVLDYYHSVAKHIPSDHELAITEAYGVANSISKWVWNKKDDSNFRQYMKNRGAMKLGPIECDLPEDKLEAERKNRQSQGAIYVNQKRTNETQKKILEAIEQLKLNGEKVTQRRISNVTGVGYSTLSRYRNFINNHILQ